MERQEITEEQGIHKEWFEQAKSKDMTLEKLPEFLNHLMNDYGHDYGTICNALIAGGIATMTAMNHAEQGGITGFQASCIMWGFIRQWNFSHNKCGLKMVDYDNMLYPQYEDKFGKTISSGIWENIKKQAKTEIENANREPYCSVTSDSPVYLHWKSILNNKIPFGYKIAED